MFVEYPIGRTRLIIDGELRRCHSGGWESAVSPLRCALASGGREKCVRESRAKITPSKKGRIEISALESEGDI